MGIQFSNALLKSLIAKTPKLLMTLCFCLSLASCLPVKKETQCSENEAFNASKRECVPTVGASTGNTVFIGSKSPANSYGIDQTNSTAKVHTIAVSDIYQYGYSIKWYVHESGSTSTTPVSFTTSYNFFANTRTPGNYIVEAIVFDATGANQLDSTSWSVNITDREKPKLTSTSPAANAFSYLNNIGATQTHSAAVNSPDLVSGNYFVFLDGAQVSTGAFDNSTSISYGFTPSALTNGLHTLEFKLYENTTSDELYDSYTWIINIIDPEYPLMLPVDGDTIPKLTETITVVNGVTFSDGGWSIPGQTNLSSVRANYGLCVNFDNADKNLPTGSDIVVKMDVNGIEFETNAQQVATNIFCADASDINNAQANFNLSNPDVAESRTITVKSYEIGTSNLVEAQSWNVAIRPTNIRPVISISTNTSSALGCTTTSNVAYTDCRLTQSVNGDRDSENGAINDYSDAAEGDSTTIAASNFEIQIDYDPDISAETHYEVFYQIKPNSGGSWEDIDITGTNTPTSQYTYSDCRYTAGETPGTKLRCSLRMDAFNNNGPLPSGDYTLRAFIRDAAEGSGTGTPKESNIVSWGLIVSENQDTGSISIASAAAPSSQAFYVNGVDQDPEVVYTTSWIGTASTPLSEVSGSLEEGQDYVLNVLVKDNQRDNFSISATITNSVLNGVSSLIPTQLITKTDSKEYTHVQLPFTLREWVVSGAASASASIVVTVQDRPESYISACTTCASASLVFTPTVTNVNPAPIFADVGTVNLSSIKAFSGQEFIIPLTIADFSDDSETDGDNITWKWQVDMNPPGSVEFDGFEDIPNANSMDQTSPELRWTPPNNIADGTIVNFRICLGDDGFGNPSDCTNANTVKQFTGVIAYNASKTITQSSTGADLATWFDTSTRTLYTTYTSGTTIFVEKQAFNTTTKIFENIHTISFETEDTEAANTAVIATDLSIDGNNGAALVIAYKVAEAGTGFLQYRVRRVDISNGKFGFNYCGTYITAPNGNHTSCETNAAVSSVDTSLYSSITPGGTRSVDITIDAGTANPGDQIVLNTSSGPVTYEIKAGASDGTSIQIVDDADNETLASNIVSAFNTMGGLAATSAQAAYAATQELTMTSSGNIVTITGSPEFDYYDDSTNIAVYLGNIKIRNSGANWAVPFASGNHSLQIAMAHGAGVNEVNGLNTSPVASMVLLTFTGTNNQEISHVYDAAGPNHFIATKNGNGNFNIHRTDSNFANASSLTNIFDLSNHSYIEDISLSLGYQNELYTSAVSVSSSGARNLAVAKLNKSDMSISGRTAAISNNSYLKYLENIDRARIIGDINNADTAFVALTTNTNSTEANSAFLIKLNTASGVDLVEYNYPKLNTNNIVSGAAISTTPLATISKIGFVDIPKNSGDSTTDADTDTGDYEMISTLFSFHESDTGNKIRSTNVNTKETSIHHQYDGTTNAESSPGFIGSN